MFVILSVHWRERLSVGEGGGRDWVRRSKGAVGREVAGHGEGLGLEHLGQSTRPPQQHLVNVTDEVKIVWWPDGRARTGGTVVLAWLWLRLPNTTW